jgi:hypothetical protein
MKFSFSFDLQVPNLFATFEMMQICDTIGDPRYVQRLTIVLSWKIIHLGHKRP